jgi:Raf kinase inhibitor-like YbhB/YbcL family protein
MKVRSDSFENEGAIPTRCAFGKHDPEAHVALSDNLNPHLAWEDVPSGTASFAILCTDSEVPSRGDDVNKEGRRVPFDLPRTEFVHWTLVDLPATVRTISEGEMSRGVVARGKPPGAPHGARQGLNDYTGWFAGDEAMKGQYHGYDGPCPPWNDERAHRYTFTVLALDVPRAAVEGSFTIAELRRALEGHVLGKASLVGTYTIAPDARPPVPTKS